MPVPPRRHVRRAWYSLRGRWGGASLAWTRAILAPPPDEAFVGERVADGQVVTDARAETDRSAATLDATIDAALVEEALRGRLEAFNELVRRHQDHLFSLVYRLVPDRDQAADAVQEAFFNAYKHLASYRGGSLIAVRDEPVHQAEEMVLVAANQLVEGLKPATQSLLDQCGVDCGIERRGASIGFGPRVGHDLPVSHSLTHERLIWRRREDSTGPCERRPTPSTSQAVPCPPDVPTWRNWHTRSILS